ncbi:MAG TPA: hypothetical protein V6C81_17655 [Planktothrix sp.]|jgi:hypothetical protein
MKTVKAHAAILLTLLPLLGNSALAQNTVAPISAQPAAAAPVQKQEIRASLRTIGPLQIADGVVIVKEENIFVLSDPADPLSDAELVGRLVNSHQINDLNGGQHLAGIAVFLNGPSLPSLKTGLIDDKVQLASGAVKQGRITTIDSSSLQMRTAQGLETCKLADVTSIDSPRAFQLSLPIVSGAAAAQVMSFTPTVTAGTTYQMAMVRATQYEKAPGKHQKMKKALFGAAMLGAVTASFGVPAAVAVSTKHVGGLKGDL